ncbi:MAG TPA: hypothetical protein VFZ91_06270 [Allosphingosinicella sp.]
MAIIRNPAYPNLLIVDGIDPSTDYRGAVRAQLYRAAARASPVRRGTHDFWMCFPYPAQPEGNPNSANFAGEDIDARNARRGARPLRGIGDMRRIPPDSGVAQVQDRLFAALHESSHAWLVPADMKVRIGRTEVAPLLSDELTDRLNREAPLERPALLARQDAHWSCYVNFVSCQDSVQWVRTPDVGGTAKWVQRDPDPVPVRPDGLPELGVFPAFSDLDLYLMGAKAAEDCFPETGGRFFWLEPKLSLGVPMQYHTGLFVAFSRSDYYYFGFYQDHGKLRAERSSTGERSVSVDIGPGYQPLEHELASMMLRVVRRGSRYLFQACQGNYVSSLLSGQGPHTFDDLDTARDSGDFRRWRTVAGFTAPGATPQAIGAITKTWNPILVEGQVFGFETKQGSNQHSFRLDNLAAPRVGTIPFGTLPADRLLVETPVPGALVRPGAWSMILGVPYAQSYDHWSAADAAPKLITRAPAGDFAFGASIKVRRSLVSPWAGGATRGMTMWGKERFAHVRDVVVPARIRENWAPWTGGPISAERNQLGPLLPPVYPTAFIVPTPRADAVPAADLAILDRFRRYYDEAVWQVSKRRFSSDSRL